jgi:hypothetical protein
MVVLTWVTGPFGIGFLRGHRWMFESFSGCTFH